MAEILQRINGELVAVFPQETLDEWELARAHEWCEGRMIHIECEAIDRGLIKPQIITFKKKG